MNEMINLIWAVCIGLGLGGFFYSGLWWTVQKTVSSVHVASWLITSMLIRMSVVLFGFYFMLKNDWLIPAWLALLVCMVAFAMARFVVTRLTHTKAKPKSHSRKGSTSKDTKHAP